MDDARVKLEKVAAALGIGGYRRHVLLCVGGSCSDPDTGAAAWDALKRELKLHGLTAEGSAACYRSKVGCLRVCTHGPILVVYPEGHWYHGMTADRIPRFVREHLIDGKPIAEWVFARNPLTEEHDEPV